MNPMELLESRLHLSAGQLDPAFGAGGFTTFSLGGVNSVSAMTVQKDGKILLAGSEADQSRFATLDTLLVRYTARGTLDPTFGVGGHVITDFGGAVESFSSVTVLSNGKILAAGTTNANGSEDFLVARFNANGRIDPTFGIGGKMTVDFNKGNDEGKALAVDSSGMIYVAGSTLAPGSLSHDFALARLKPNGQVDNSFGHVTTDFDATDDEATTIALDGTGIILGGHSAIGINDNFALARYQHNGLLDPKFGKKGLVTTDFQGNADTISSIAISNKKIIAAGSALSAGFDRSFALARYTLSGLPDKTFGKNGKTTFDLGVSHEDAAAALVVTPDKKLLIAGQTRDVTNSNNPTTFAVARFMPNGGIDRTFNHTGFVTSSFALPGGATALAFNTKSQILVAGTVLVDNSDMDILLAAYKSK
jgi:uncharacterized delta-60 repeat protein